MKRPKNSTSDIAIALHYDGSNAPTVTAKGRDQLARRIMQVAQEHGVPLHEDEYLVQFLSTIELGDEIPENLYRAVAEVIAFAYYLSGRVPGDPV
jgi:flagellar biosynthesis protein